MQKAKNTSVTLGERFEKIIKDSIDTGRYASASEVIREGLRLVEEREQKIRAISEALEAGEKSGFLKDFDPELFLKELRAKYAK